MSRLLAAVALLSAAAAGCIPQHQFSYTDLGDRHSQDLSDTGLEGSSTDSGPDEHQDRTDTGGDAVAVDAVDSREAGPPDVLDASGDACTPLCEGKQCGDDGCGSDCWFLIFPCPDGMCPAPCGNGNACDGIEVCDQGQCKPGTSLDCDDENPCTDDLCDPGLGCRHDNNTDSCDDSNPCTTGDVCSNGDCFPGLPDPVACPQCGGGVCPPLDGYSTSCNPQEHCEYANKDASGWKKWDVWVRVEPGKFEMGTPDGEIGTPAYEQPVHTVTIGYALLVAKYEIVVEEYEACNAIYPPCTAAHATQDPSSPGTNTSAAGRPDHPQNGLTWQQARDFCAWVAPGGRLPSEAEWEYAASGTVHRVYPWGNSPPPACDNNTAVFNQAGGPGGYGCGLLGTWQVGFKTAGASWSGALDMGGNLLEWCEDYDHEDYDLDNDGVVDAPVDGSAWLLPATLTRVVRGGSFKDDAAHLRCSKSDKAGPDTPSAGIGARCVRPLP